MALRIFISYSSRDRLDALRLKEIADVEGHTVWMDQFDIRAGAGLTQELRQSVSSADVLCLLLSPAAVASPWVREEVAFALSAESKPVRLLPIIIRAAPIPEELADVVAVDATRGLDDDAVVTRIHRTLGGDIADALILDAARRAELADRAAIEAAEARWPAIREALDRVIDQPVRELDVSVDQDGWPDCEGSVIEIVLDIDIFKGALHLLLAPYVEGRTWRADAGLDERPPQEFLGWTVPRVDGRLLWAGRVLTAANTLDGTDLGELPARMSFNLPGDEFTGNERATTMALLERFELPSLRQLIDAGSTVTVWQHPREGEPRRLDPARTDLRLRLTVPLRHDETGLSGFRLWSFHDRDDAVLLRSPTLTDCATDLEREAVLSLYRNVPLRDEQNSPERRQRLAEAVERGDAVDDADRWAAFTLAVGRANVPRVRGRRALAAQIVHDALGILGEIDETQLDRYGNAFRLVIALKHLVDDLAMGGGTAEAIGFYSGQLVELTRRLWDLHPEEADYARALSRALFQRARSIPDTPAAASDVREAVAVLDALVSANPMPWRVDEARDARRDAEALLSGWRNGATSLEPPPAATGAGAAWLDATTRAHVVPTRVVDRLLRFGASLPPAVPAPAPRLTVADGELVGVWDQPESVAGLVVGLADGTSGLRTVADGVLAGTAPSPLPGRGPWSLAGAYEETVPDGLRDRLEVDDACAVRLDLRYGDHAVRGYLLVVAKADLRWRVCLTLPASGDDWQARTADDRLAAVAFAGLSMA